ncbi:porin PorA family protein [Nocardia higoensis]|uniref:porin PorA family protein n=1 Tax=Nocardia higoensis TaxID=228599 RepID=UPI00030B4D2B|nr:porin PorA family protein [Nocardia higoensis]
MSVRKSSVVWAALGVVLIVGAVVIRFLVLPAMTKLPDDLSQSQRYEGTMQGLNAQAFAAGDLANLLSPQMPITADRSLTVDAVDGDTAIVTSNSVVTLPDSSTQDDIHTYAVDRVDYSPVTLGDEEKNSLVPADRQATFEAHSGLTFSWPMDPAAEDALLYDPVTRTAQTATFIDESDVQGRKVYNYRVDAAGPIGNPALLAGFADFPAQLPKAMIEGLLQAGVVPEKSRENLAAALPSLPDLVDIGFGSTNEVGAAVDAEFGAPLQVEQTQAMYVTVSADGRGIPTLPLSVVSIHTAENEVVASADTLSKNSTMLSILGLWLPLVMTVLGIALVVLGIVRRRTA